MNATHTACCSVAALPTQRPPWQRVWLDMHAAVDAWRAAAWQRQCERALQGLSEETLRDIGMAERVAPRQPTLGVLDYERGRWS